jgi:hypothetical protein
MRLAGSAVALGILLASTAFASKTSDAWDRFEQSKWSTVHKLAQVPSDVLTALRAHLGEDPRLADVANPFDATGNNGSLPPRRLVLAGHSPTDWFILYEEGGLAHRLVFVDFEMASEPQPVLLATGSAGVYSNPGGWRVDLRTLKKGLETGTMHWGDATAAKY